MIERVSAGKSHTSEVRRRVLASMVMLSFTGCTPFKLDSRQGSRPVDHWSGRLSLVVESERRQSFTASFELRGTVEHGELALIGPVGSLLARLTWRHGRATLTSGGETRNFESLDSLIGQLALGPLPVGALFDWLAGRETPADGWHADLSQLGAGRLAAHRVSPEPPATLRLILD